MNAGKNRSGTQRCFCKEYKKYYTLEPKTREYPEEIRQQAIKTYYVGASGRGVGKVFGFSKANVYNWIKKTPLPRQIVGFDAALDKSPERIQRIVDTGFKAKCYCTDGYLGYIDVVYPSKHIRNAGDKSDTFTVEGVNADLRRRSRCFPRKLETLRTVLELFVQAYNDFGIAKMNFRQNRRSNSRELPFSLLDFL